MARCPTNKPKPPAKKANRRRFHTTDACFLASTCLRRTWMLYVQDKAVPTALFSCSLLAAPIRFDCKVRTAARCGTLRKLSRPIEAPFAPRAGVAFNALGGLIDLRRARPKLRFGAVVFNRCLRAISGRKSEQALRLNLLGSRLGPRRTHLEHDVVSCHRIRDKSIVCRDKAWREDDRRL